MWKGITIGSLLGTFTGILPAVGQDTATVLAYNQTKTMSKHPEKFGTGYAAGIAASESSNNAVNGGALIPFVLPGDPRRQRDSCSDWRSYDPRSAAWTHAGGGRPGGDWMHYAGVFSGKYCNVSDGNRPDEHFCSNDPDSQVPSFPAILVCCVLGVYAINNRIFEVLVMVVSGIVAYFLLNYFKLDLIAILLGYLLGPLLETYLRTAMIADQGNLLAFTQHPIALGLIVAAVIVLAGQAFFRKSRRKSCCVSRQYLRAGIRQQAGPSFRRAGPSFI